MLHSQLKTRRQQVESGGRDEVIEANSFTWVCFTVFTRVKNSLALAPTYHSHTHTLKNKVSLLASTVPWRTFNIHENFPFHKRFFRLLKCSSQIYFNNCSLKGYLRSQKWFFCVITAKPTLFSSEPCELGVWSKKKKKFIQLIIIKTQ